MSKIALLTIIGIMLLDPSTCRAEAKSEAKKERKAAARSHVKRTPACLVATSDGQYYLAGNSYSREKGQSFWIWKVNAKGEAIWQKNFQSENQDEVTNLMATDDGGVLALGLIFVYQPKIGYRSWIRKLSKDGDTAYTKIIRGYGRAGIILRTDDDNYLLGGTSSRKEDKKKHSDAWLVKIDSRGKVLWEQFHDRGSDESVYSGVNIENGGFVFLGAMGQYNKFGQGPSEIWVFKCDSAGKIVAEAKLPNGRIMSKGGQFIAKNKEQFAIVYTTSQLPPICNVDVTRMPSFAAQVVGFNYALEQLWNKQIAGYSSIMTPLITTTTDGDYLVAGAVQKGPKVDKISIGGKEIWTKTSPVKSGGFPIYNVQGLAIEKTIASIVGSVIDPMSGNFREGVFLLKMETKTPKILWQKSY